jgi:nicotinate-nucleotide pyrophosphorylase (carboxylating)
MMSDQPIHDSRITRLIELALMEDIGAGDVTTDGTVGESVRGYAEFLCKTSGTIAGLEIAGLVFSLCDEDALLTPRLADGSKVSAGQVVATVKGPARGLLRGERTALNFLQRMSGIATETARYVDAVRGTGARITDTRKTAPGLRALDKMAVRLGGGVNHRFGLDDMALIKDNHIAAAGSIPLAVRRVRGAHPGLPIEVEVTTLAQLSETLPLGVDRIMLDNMDLDAMRRAVERAAGRVPLEASGGVTLANAAAVAATGVDFISIGALTHSAPALDISLEIAPAEEGG